MPRKKLYPDVDAIRLTVRMPVDLKEAVEKVALANRRSLNQEIVVLLEEAVQYHAKARGKAKRSSAG